MKEVNNYADKGVEILLIGNKSDLADRREVPYSEAADLASKHNMIFYECSAKEGDNVGQAFVEMAKKLMKKK